MTFALLSEYNKIDIWIVIWTIIIMRWREERICPQHCWMSELSGMGYTMDNMMMSRGNVSLLISLIILLIYNICGLVFLIKSSDFLLFHSGSRQWKTKSFCTSSFGKSYTIFISNDVVGSKMMALLLQQYDSSY